MVWSFVFGFYEFNFIFMSVDFIVIVGIICISCVVFFNL